MQPTERRLFFILILIAGLAWIFFSMDNTGSSTAGEISAPQEGFVAPDFTLETTDQQTITLSELKGQAVLVNVWATWCPPCRAEMPAIEKLYLEYRDRGFIVLGLNDTVQDKQEAIIPFIKEYNLTFPILLDELGEVSHTYQIRSLPTSFFINRDGTVNEVVVGGPMSEALLRTRIEDILQ
jgi:cytochrome c biogenesis protein CcmG/thiol:disulfide interchange protein DsbE